MIHGKYTIRKLVEFECAHQLTKAKSHLCNATIHGHSYKCELFFEAGSLKDSMVVDFGALAGIKKKIMQTFDHALFMPDELKHTIDASSNERLFIVHDSDPSAEWMSRYIYESVDRMMGLIDDIPEGVLLSKVRVHETRTGWAEYEAIRDDEALVKLQQLSKRQYQTIEALTQRINNLELRFNNTTTGV